MIEPHLLGLYEKRSVKNAVKVSLIAVLGMIAISGCTTVGVKPWQRDLLAREDMVPDSNALDASTDDHLYFSKEASTGGRGFAGGGCGCN